MRTMIGACYQQIVQIYEHKIKSARNVIYKTLESLAGSS